MRNQNFEEVALGLYAMRWLSNEAERCLQLQEQALRVGLPGERIDIPDFIAKVGEGDLEGAYEVITSSSSLPAVCGRVCPQETQCEGKCVRGIKGEPVAIGRLERFVADWHMSTAPAVKPEKPVPNGHKVAVVGSGPSGLTCAGDLGKAGL